jgi:putative endonuclease
MRTEAQTLGDRAEDLVARHLRAAGWIILGRNLRAGRAEIDLLAIDPGPPAALVVVEVRWRSRRDFGIAEETVDHRKLGRLRAAGYRLRSDGRLATGVPVPPHPVRVDLIVMEPGDATRHHRAVA